MCQSLRSLLFIVLFIFIAFLPIVTVGLVAVIIVDDQSIRMNVNPPVSSVKHH